MKKIINPIIISIVLVICFISSCNNANGPNSNNAPLDRLESIKNYKFKMEVHGIDYWITRYAENSTNNPKDTSVITFDTIRISINTTFTFSSGSNLQFYPRFGYLKKVVKDTLYIQYQTCTGYESGSSTYYNYSLDEARIEFSRDKPTIKNLRLQIIKGQDWDKHNNYEYGSSDLDHRFIMVFENLPYTEFNGAYKVSLSSANIIKFLTLFNTYRNYTRINNTNEHIYTGQWELWKLITDIPLFIGNDAFVNIELYP